MITNFEGITYELTKEEKMLIPILITGFKSHTKQNPIKAPNIIKKINEYIYTEKLGFSKMTEARLRKIVNYIRTNSMLGVIATSKGYYHSTDKKEIEQQIESLIERANGIYAAAFGLQNFVKDL